MHVVSGGLKSRKAPFLISDVHCTRYVQVSSPSRLFLGRNNGANLGENVGQEEETREKTIDHPQ